MTAVRILGLDPGLRITGFGVIERHGARLAYVASGCIRSGEGTLPERLATLFRGVDELIATYRPTEAAVEKVFVNLNPQSTLLLGQARGAVLCAALLGGTAVHEYTALQVKQAVVGYGKADKVQVQEMVTRLLGLDATPGPDAADALACAICHAHQSALPYAAQAVRRRGGRLLVPPPSRR